ncbi:HAD-IIA family hydrolase [Ilumatobacter sp.]|uniref:HAD-IIA family hydrolase n=1 Tax=Ilumatobacter sp. TaxID=1967498 RepID=UPI003AF4A77C
MADRSAPTDHSSIEFVLCDLDGVVWLARRAIAGAPEAIARLRASGRRVLFVTNNSVSTVADQEQALAAIGVPATGDVVTSAQAAASLVGDDDSVLVCGGPGVVEAVTAIGAEVVAIDGDEPADTVIVGLDRSFDFARLTVTSRAIRGGAGFVATNDDPTFPTPTGFTPGAGSIVAAVATAAGREPVIAGKPHAPMAELVRRRCGPRFSARTALMVGDRWSTDGAFARELGCPFAMVRSGVTPVGADPGGDVDIDETDLASVADLILGAERPDSVDR